MKFSPLGFATAALLALCMTLAPVADARPPGPPGGPGWHRPGPPPHFRAPARVHHRHHYGWLWAPAAVGAAIWGWNVLNDPYDDYVPYRYRYAPSYAAPAYSPYWAAERAEQSAARAEAAASAAQAAAAAPKTLYWCEAEKGFYPQVRACPTGWTPVSAPP